jgi:hypothetical protein
VDKNGQNIQELLKNYASLQGVEEAVAVFNIALSL